MSLFKAREWWQVTCGSGEEFDGGCLCVGNVDNDSSGQVKIVTGSLQGNLRIYYPKERDYKAEDLLLEIELDQAILQVAVGRFYLGGGLHLAVLHPRKLVVYTVQSVGNGSYLQLSKLYEHYLEHTAANMTYGPFGGAQGVDYLCVQSYDGQLSFYECEALVFSRFLPNFLIPGALCYCEASDSFITCGAGFEVESYKYKVLAAASGEKQTAGPVAGVQVAKKLQADWRVILGEGAIDIRVGRLTQGQQAYQADIVVLCEHNVFVLNTSGQVTFQKRLEYHPACCWTYPAPGAKLPGGPENLLVVTHTKAALVYRGNVLCWAAKMDTQPVAVQVADIGPHRGMLVTLDDGGRLGVAYLGTDPMVTPVGFMDTKDLDYEAMSQEHRQLAAIIRQNATGQRVEPPDRLIMRTQVPLMFDSMRHHGVDIDGLGGSMSGNRTSSAGGHGRRLTIKLYMTYEGAASGASDVSITVRPPEPVLCEEPSFVVRHVSNTPTEPDVAYVTFLTNNAHLPASATATLLASFTTGGNEPRAQHLTVDLPMCLFCQVIPPVKAAAYKLTIATNRNPPQISSLFEDMLAQAVPGVAQTITSGAAGANVISFQYWSGQDVTIIVSKNGGRYRLQSDCFEAMWLVMQELVKRLTAYYHDAELGGQPAPEGRFTVSFEDALPLEDYFEVVEAHFQCRAALAAQQQQLEDRAVQFRQLQKRLLMRFKDKNPSPLNQLDVLMEETYHDLMALGEAVEASTTKLGAAAARLAAATQLLLQLVRYRFNLQEDEYQLLRCHLSPEVLDTQEVGWEEQTEASMTQLLRTCLAKSAKEAAVTIGQLGRSKDTQRLRKHIALVLERLARGMRLYSEEGQRGLARQASKARAAQAQAQPAPPPAVVVEAS